MELGLIGVLSGIAVGIWAWPVLTAAVLLVVFSFGLAWEKEGWVTGGVILVLVLTSLGFWGHIDGWTLAAYIAGYLVIGILMTYPLYNSYSRRKARDWKELLQAYYHNQPVNWANRTGFYVDWYSKNLSKEVKQSMGSWNYVKLADMEGAATKEQQIQVDVEWLKFYKDRLLEKWNSSNWILQVSGTDHGGELWAVTNIKKYLVGQMILWMIYWPSYTLVMLLRDALQNFWEWVLEHIGGHFERMSTGHFNA